jgi:hypothetical protein
MYIMSKHSTIPNCFKFDFHHDDRYKDILLSLNCSQAFTAQSVRRRIFYLDVRGSYPVSAQIFCFFAFFSLFLYIQMFFYTIMKLFSTFLEIVNKSRTSAGRLSLNIYYYTVLGMSIKSQPYNVLIEDYVIPGGVVS